MPEPRALRLDRMPEADLASWHAERHERIDQCLIRVDQRAVEVEHHHRHIAHPVTIRDSRDEVTTRCSRDQRRVGTVSTGWVSGASGHVAPPAQERS